MIKTELTDELQNLGDASGFDKEFSASFWIYIVIILVLAMLTLFLYMKYYKRAVSEHSN